MKPNTIEKYVDSNEFRADANSFIMGLGVGLYAGYDANQELFTAIAGVAILLIITGQLFENWVKRLKTKLRETTLGGERKEIVRRLTKEPEASLLGSSLGYFGYLVATRGPQGAYNSAVDVLTGLL